MGFWMVLGLMVSVFGVIVCAASPAAGGALIGIGTTIMFWAWIVKNLNRHFALQEQQCALLSDIKSALGAGSVPEEPVSPEQQA